MPSQADFIANYFFVNCPSCGDFMKAGVLSGSSDMTGHTNEYFCPEEKCQQFKIRVTLSVRDPERMPKVEAK